MGTTFKNRKFRAVACGLWLVACGLWLVACKQESKAESNSAAIKHEDAAAEEQTASLEQRCKELSKQTGKDYQVVSGEVIRSGITPLPPGDCFTESCLQKQAPLETSFFSVIQSMKSDAKENEFYIYTKKELLKTLQEKEPYAKEGNRYKFCALQIKEASKYHKGKLVFEISNAEMIQEIKELPLEQRCKELSKQYGKDYQVVSGEVTKTGILPQPAVDCFKTPCPELMKTSFFAEMSSLNDSKNGARQNFSVYTPRESMDELEKKVPYFQEGKQYKFCAYKADLSRFEIYDLRYGIDHPQTIEEITRQKRPYHIDLLEHMKDSPAYPGLDKEYEQQLKNLEIQKGSEDGK